MSPTLNHPAAHLLQFTFTPDEYRALRVRYTRAGEFSPGLDRKDYWDKLPTYVVSRCPYTGAEFTAQLDTHGLSGRWMTHPDRYEQVFNAKRQSIGSDYFVAVHCFVELHGEIEPRQHAMLDNHFEVPFVMDVLLPGDISSYAVLHSLPICRLDGDEFVPTYTLWMITYYSSDPERLRNRRRNDARREAEEEGLPDGARGPFLYPTSRTWAHPDLYDLKEWVHKERLLWIDPATDALELRRDEVEKFPYISFTGN